MVSEKNSRWDEIRRIHIAYETAYRILGGIFLVAFIAWVGSKIIDDGDSYGTNIFTEALGVFATIVIVNTWYHDRDKRRREQELKNRLLRDVRSPEPVIARHALHEINVHGMLAGELGLLKGEYLPRVKWEGGVLDRANLACAVLPYSCLQGAQLNETYFEGATLWYSKLDRVKCSVGANFKSTQMRGATITSAWLHFVDFSNADLQETDFSGANLFHTKLINADLRAAKFKHVHINNVSFIGANLLGAEIEGNFYDGHIILPDGKILKRESDFAHFTEVRV